MRYKGIVLNGNKEGRTIGFPTVNLSPTLIPADTPKGVYKTVVSYKNEQYAGALYFGPRLVKNESHTVLEIFILEFQEEIYGEQIEFTLDRFVRGVMDFKSFDKLKEQLEKDVEEVKK